MRLTLWSSFVAALLLSGLARGESPPSRCNYGWWAPYSGWPAAIVEAPPDPHVPLPVQWVSVWGDRPSEEALASPVLRVSATDSMGTAVPGELGLGADVAVPLPQYLDLVFWRPTAELAPGETYTLEVEVAAAEGYGYYGCPGYTGFTKTVGVTIATEPYAARLDTRVTTRDVWGDWQYAPCGERASSEWVACADYPAFCCRASSQRQIHVAVANELPLPNDGVLHVYRVSVTAPGVDHLPLIAPALPRALEPATFVFHGTPGAAPGRETVCAGVRLYDLLAGRQVASTWTCADPAEHQPAPAPAGGLCDASVCAALSGSGDLDAYLGGPDAISVSDAVPGSDLVPNGTPRAQGCAGGDHDPLAMSLAVALALCVSRRRRHRGDAAHADC